MIYVYCLTDASAAAGYRWPPGMSGAPVETVEYGRLALVISELRQLPSPVRRTDLQCHDAVNRAALMCGVCVPWQYGTMLETRQVCVEVLAGRREHWSQMLEQLRDRVELSVRVVLPAGGLAPVETAVPEGVGPGAAYLLRRQADLLVEQEAGAQSERIAQELRRSLGALPEALKVETRGRLLAIAALLHRDAFEQAAVSVSAVAAREGGRWSVSEPWPPYSFVDELV